MTYCWRWQHPDYERASGPGSGYSDTIDSHRLAWYAATVGKGEATWDELSRRFYEGRPEPIVLGDHAKLLEVAAVVGLDVAETKRVLETGEYKEEVKAADRQMRLKGIEGIPVIFFDVQSTGRGDPLRGALPKVRTDGSRYAADPPVLRLTVLLTRWCWSRSVKEFREVFEQMHHATV